MKEFRGSIIALLVLIVVGVLYRMQDSPEELEEGKEQVLFRFEKHDVVRVEILPPSGERIDLQEKDGKWVVSNKNWNANPSMINRIKHQLHDLNARTIVTKEADNPTLYGLGKNAIQVSISFRKGNKTSFLVGDPNPSGVSYYIQPLPGTVVYTVKKSALDYFSHDINGFRNPRFAQFDIKDAQSVRIHSETNDLLFQKDSLGHWNFPKESLDIDTGEMRTILSKIASLKAVRFVDSTPSVLKYGLSNPILSVQVSLPQEELEVVLGASFKDGREKLSYVQRKGDDTIYVVRASLEDLIQVQPISIRNKRITKVSSKDIVQITGVLHEEEKLTSVIIEKKAENWSWDDGTLISGSTPDRLASAIADLRALSFEEFSSEQEEVAHLVFSTEDVEQTLYIGSLVSEVSDEEGLTMQRYHAWIGREQYTIDGHTLRVLSDLVREYRRKIDGDAKKEALHNRIDKKED